MPKILTGQFKGEYLIKGSKKLQTRRLFWKQDVSHVKELKRVTDMIIVGYALLCKRG